MKENTKPHKKEVYKPQQTQDQMEQVVIWKSNNFRWKREGGSQSSKHVKGPKIHY